jgi:hypothetical protein
VTGCGRNVELVLFWGFELSLKVIGSREILGKRVVQDSVMLESVMFQFHQGMTLAVIVGIEKVVV